MAPKNVIVTRQGTAATIIVVPPADDGLADELRKAFVELLAADVRNITVDVEGVQVVHTTALGSIVFACRQLQKTNSRLSLIHVSPSLREIFSNLSLDKLVDIR